MGSLAGTLTADPPTSAEAILAEMLAISRGFEGGFLNGSSESLHTPADRRLLASS